MSFQCHTGTLFNICIWFSIYYSIRAKISQSDMSGFTSYLIELHEFFCREDYIKEFFFWYVLLYFFLLLLIAPGNCKYYRGNYKVSWGYRTYSNKAYNKGKEYRRVQENLEGGTRNIHQGLSFLKSFSFAQRCTSSLDWTFKICAINLGFREPLDKCFQQCILCPFRYLEKSSCLTCYTRWKSSINKPSLLPVVL